MAPLLTVRLDRDEIARVDPGDPPCELTPSREADPNTPVEFRDGSGRPRLHTLGELSGWAHFSIRVHAGLACQIDCVVTQKEKFAPGDLMKDGAHGIRFQPFLLPGSSGDPQALVGQGLFKRGLHFGGRVTPGNVRLSCKCDACARSFQDTVVSCRI